MKKIVAMGAAAALALTLAGCSGGTADQQQSGEGAPSASQDAQNAAPAKENKLTVTDSGWSVDDQGYVHYGIIVKNEGSQGALFPTIKVTGKDESGNVVSSDQQTLMSLRPDQEVAWGGQAGNGTAPATVEFELSVGSNNWQDSDENIDMFKVDGVSAQDSGYGTVNFVGEITSLLTDTDMDQVAVSIILRNGDGAIVGGYTGFAENLAAGATTSFDVLGYGVPEYVDFEAWAQPWMVASQK
ncbi:hypothetical protein [Gordonibacter massiliensis (ex Traore et al. 2017)]|uniref:hypothetical protein n=1 Tax=Gordonibacter massiliensis (ex Traore et al. 2017) TaxID=1841863 RepID=UPI001C8BB326|nr:hypothetical protein [Gordonibacter massiliensis (ex Traore et al. 2017)]MBX9032491.1 hypothetical protein [Gordonibacter massiliensis (ex Traore et al. 2017)]